MTTTITNVNSSKSYTNETVSYLSKMREGSMSPRPPPQRQGGGTGKSPVSSVRHARHSYPCESPSLNRTGSSLSSASQLWISGRTFEDERGEGETDDGVDLREDESFGEVQSVSSFDRNNEMEEELSSLCQDENLEEFISGDSKELVWDKSPEKAQEQLTTEARQVSPTKQSYLAPKERFCRAVRQVKKLCAVQIGLNKLATEAGKGTFGATLPDLVASLSRTPSVVYMPSTKEKLTFDAGDFKSKYEFTWPRSAKLAIDKRPEDRTDSDILLIGGLMRGLQSFRKYTRAHQRLICRVVRFQKYGRRRVVIRKGHLGYAFYFIFAGAVCVTLDEDEESAFVKKEVTILKKGACFGEVALLKDTRRNATIVCLQDTEFLVVDRDDFFQQGLHQHIHKESEYKHNFLRRHPLFSSWPDNKLEEISDIARIEEHNHGSVIVKDSRETHWLLFVTKGCCDVLKLVDIAKVYAARHEEELNKKKHPLSGGGGGGLSSMLSGDYPLSLLPEGQRSPFPWLTPHKLPVNSRPKTTGQINGKSRDKMETIESEPNRHQRSKSANVTSQAPDYIEGDITTVDSRSTMTSSLSMHKRRFSDPATPLKLPSHVSFGISTMKGDDVDAGVYIKVDSLRPGQCFGIEGTMGKMPQYSLLSLGCEIVRVSITKFREFACETTLEKAVELIPKYPSDDDLWASFLKQSRWTNFKNGIVRTVMEDAQAQSVPSMFGKDHRSSSAKSHEVHHNQRRRVSLGSSFASNVMPRISNATSAWMDDGSSRSKSRDGVNSRSSYAVSRPQSSQQQSRPPTSKRHNARSERLTALVADNCTSRATTPNSLHVQKIPRSKLSPSPTRLSYRVPEMDRPMKPTYTGSISWRALAKS
ncbi:cyclic nucleotide-binding domain-containing protein 2-like [Asterias rubens]|uniref:cyclic nucleotide-binding domain-containing protein 2-like n=1 Tax=Asterias rubens TaxID=7604 RepID=UPI00145579DE|nr:cyclic nucleotide-binding domain-containing protein 2-like [Asterias rubens]